MDDENVQMRVKEPMKFHEGWLERRMKDKKWEELWLVLKGSNIYIFTHEREHTSETHKGILPLNARTRFERKTKEERHGFYVFELYAENEQRDNWTNRFKTDRKSDMEMWRGYIHALSKGNLPSNLDLPANTTEDMRILLERYNNISSPIERLSTLTGASGNSMDSGVDISVTGGADSRSVATRTNRSSSSGETKETLLSRGSGGSGGRNKRHKFSNNPLADDVKPSWFFSNCSRDYTLKIFRNKGCRYGDTLMRESSTNAADGNYVISHCSDIKMNGDPVCDHYKVIRTYRGFKLDIDNPHNEMTNLTEVMTFFTEINGQERTHPMTTNDLTTLGLEDPDYRYTQYVQLITKKEPINVMKSLQEPPPDAEDYLDPSPSHVRKTYTPGMFNKERSEYLHQQENRVSHYDFRRQDVPSHTVAARNSYSRRQSSPASMVLQQTYKARQRNPGDNISQPPDYNPPEEIAPPPPHTMKLDENQNLDYEDTAAPSKSPPSFPAPPPPVNFNQEKTERNKYFHTNISLDLPPPNPHVTQSIGYENEKEGFDEGRQHRSKSVPNIMPEVKQSEDILSRRVTTKSIVANPPKSILVTPEKKNETTSPSSINTSLSVTGLWHVEPSKPKEEPKDSVKVGVDDSSQGAVSSIAKRFESVKVENTKGRQAATKTPSVIPRLGGGYSHSYTLTEHHDPEFSTYYNADIPTFTKQGFYTNTTYPSDEIYENANNADEIYDDTSNSDTKRVTFEGPKDNNTSQSIKVEVGVDTTASGTNTGFKNELERVLQNISSGHQVQERPRVTRQISDDNDLYESLPELPEEEDT